MVAEEAAPNATEQLEYAGSALKKRLKMCPKQKYVLCSTIVSATNGLNNVLKVD